MSDILNEFIKNDIVSIKRGNCNDTEETLLFTISEFENDKVYLLGLESAYSIEDLVPVAITDKAIKNINCSITYMASVLEPDETGPLLPKGQRLDISVNDEDISDLIKKHSIKYVHELQYILKEEQTCIHLNVSSTFSHLNILQQNQTVNE